jgi:hypothetical protein
MSIKCYQRFHSDASRQLTLDLEPGLLDRYRSLRDVMAAAVYARGLKRMAS